MRLRTFGGSSWYPPIVHKVFRHPIFSETLKGSRETFWHSETKKPRLEVTVTPLNYAKIFTFQNFFKSYKVSTTKIFGTVRLKQYNGTSWYPAIGHHVFFDTRNFLKKRRVLRRTLSVQWDIKFDGKSWYRPIMHKIFWKTQTSWNLEGFPAKLYGILRQKTSEAKTWYHFSYA